MEGEAFIPFGERPLETRIGGGSKKHFSKLKGWRSNFGGENSQGQLKGKIQSQWDFGSRSQERQGYLKTEGKGDRENFTTSGGHGEDTLRGGNMSFSGKPDLKT